MKPKHKYFRNQRHKNKLECKYDNGYNDVYPCNVMFYTKCVDTRDVRENWNYFARNSSYTTWHKQGNKYVYYTRPEVAYSIHKYHRRRERCKKFFKKYSNKVVRRTKDTYNNGAYKKVFDLWWILY